MIILFYILMFLPLIVDVAVFRFLPHQIPMHFNWAHQVTHWGNRYEIFIFPILVVCIDMLVRTFAKRSHNAQLKKLQFNENNTNLTTMDKSSLQAHKNDLNGNERYGILLKIGLLVFLSIINVGVIITGLNHSMYLFYGIYMDELILFFLGLLFIEVAVILPLLTRNPYFDFRTKKTRLCDIHWTQAQKFVGKTTIAFGIALVAIALLFEGSLLIMSFTTTLCIYLAIILFYNTFLINQQMHKTS